jgi:phage tail-like protein
MPTARHDDPYAKFHFVIEFEMMKAGFSEVEGLPTDNDTDYPSSSERTEIRKLPGKRKYTNISLKRGYTNSRELYTWGKRGHGKVEQEDVGLQLTDQFHGFCSVGCLADNLEICFCLE